MLIFDRSSVRVVVESLELLGDGIQASDLGLIVVGGGLLVFAGVLAEEGFDLFAIVAILLFLGGSSALRKASSSAACRADVACGPA